MKQSRTIMLASLVGVIGMFACDVEHDPEMYEQRSLESEAPELVVAEELGDPDAAPDGTSRMEIYWDETDHALYVSPSSKVNSKDVEAILEELAQELGIATTPQQLPPVCCKAVCVQGTCVIPGVADGSCTCYCVGLYPFCTSTPFEW